RYSPTSRPRWPRRPASRAAAGRAPRGRKACSEALRRLAAEVRGRAAKEAESVRCGDEVSTPDWSYEINAAGKPSCAAAKGGPRGEADHDPADHDPPERGHRHRPAVAP